jgi:hypothetical protein
MGNAENDLFSFASSRNQFFAVIPIFCLPSAAERSILNGAKITCGKARGSSSRHYQRDRAYLVLRAIS